MRALVLSGGSAHGAFQAGAIHALYERGWVPDIICGSSVGAINAVGIASGKDPDDLCRLWQEVENTDVFRWRSPQDWLKFWQWSYLLDTSPLRNLLLKELDLDRLGESHQLVTCFSTNVLTGQLRGYTNSKGTLPEKFIRKYSPVPLDVDAVLASAAIPFVFPPVRGEWDGALLHYAPLKPAVLLGATEIIVVSLSSQNEPETPKGIIGTALRILELSTISGLRSDLRILEDRNKHPAYRNISVKVIAPTADLGYSKMNFTSPRKSFAIHHGRTRVHQVMDSP